MKKIVAVLMLALLAGNTITAQTKTVKLRFIETSDVHGSFFPYDFINRKPKNGSMARVISYVDSLRESYGENLILVDNGDILQGQPTCYYYNYVNTSDTNVAADVVNYMKYDAEVFGNHDIETGHAVYDKWVKEVNCPVLGANVINTKTGKPYTQPYIILNRDGVKIAILGMLTPAIPNWLTENLWSGLRFDNMVESAKYWMKYLKEHEDPDVVVGVFHSGRKGGIITDKYEEDASIHVAQAVPGFDLILYGHDHTAWSSVVKNTKGKDVVCLDPANNAVNIADAEIIVHLDEHVINNKIVYMRQGNTVHGKIVDITDRPVSEAFMKHFQPQIDKVNTFVNRKIGNFNHAIYTRDSYFGSSEFNDFIANLELKITGADIAFNAPLQFNAKIDKGDIHVSDMFNLYKFENQLYVMKLTGEEIRKHLEMSYDLWANTMKDSTDHLLLLDMSKGDNQHTGFKNFTFNFDSATGIDYIVDVTKPNGQKVKILKMSNGQPFDEHKWYKVAVNSYRANGGGELLTKGAGIPKDSLSNRIIYRSPRDLRYYLMQEIEKMGTVNPKATNNWKFVPEKWTTPAAERDYQLLFGKRK